MLNDQDLILLESYLDDDLSPEQVARADERLAADPSFAAGLADLRRQRALRAAALASVAPSPVEAQALADRLLLAVHRLQRQRKFARLTWIAGGIAACLIAGFGVGWIGRGWKAPEPLAQNVNPTTDPVTIDDTPDKIPGVTQPPPTPAQPSPNSAPPHVAVVQTNPAPPAVHHVHHLSEPGGSRPDDSADDADAPPTQPAATAPTQRIESLGLAVTTDRHARPGSVRIVSVVPHTAADNAGLRAGDILLSIDDHPILDSFALADYLSIHRGTVNLRVRRGDTDILIAISR